MKLRLAIGVLALAFIGASVAYAGGPRVGELVQGATGNFETTIQTAVSGGAVVSGFGNGNILYGFSVVPTAANGWCALYDASATSSIANTQGVFIDEGGSASQTAVYQSLWPAPYRLQTGLVVECVNAKAIIYHDVK